MNRYRLELDLELTEYEEGLLKNVGQERFLTILQQTVGIVNRVKGYRIILVNTTKEGKESNGGTESR